MTDPRRPRPLHDRLTGSALRCSILAVVLVAGIGCSTDGDTGAIEAADSNVGKSIDEVAAAPVAPDVDDPWSGESPSGLDLEKSQRLLGTEACAPTPSISSGETLVVRIVDGCPRMSLEEVPDDAALAALRAQPDVVAADVVEEVSTTAADPDRDRQWALDTLNADDIQVPKAIDDVSVAVIDSGIDLGHPDLRDTEIKHVTDVLQLSPRDNAKIGHGTHVAGIIGATADNGKAGRGLAPGVHMLGIQVTASENDKSVKPVPLSIAIVSAVDLGVTAVNMSIATTSGRKDEKVVAQFPTQDVEWAVRYARYRDVVLVAAAGNCGSPDKGERDENDCVERNQAQYPAAYAGVIGVGATDDHGYHGKFSTANQYVDLAAPGVGIYSAKAGSDGVQPMDGTSQAAPFVTATVALLRAIDPTLSRSAVWKLLVDTASRKGSDRSNEFGYGILNAKAAVEAAKAGASTGSATPTTPVPPVPPFEWSEATYDARPCFEGLAVTGAEAVDLTQGEGRVAVDGQETFVSLDGVIPLAPTRSVILMSCGNLGPRANGIAGLAITPENGPVTLTGVVQAGNGNGWSSGASTVDPAVEGEALHTSLLLDGKSFVWSTPHALGLDGTMSSIVVYSVDDAGSAIVQQPLSYVLHPDDSTQLIRQAAAACRDAFAAYPSFSESDQNEGIYLFNDGQITTGMFNGAPLGRHVRLADGAATGMPGSLPVRPITDEVAVLGIPIDPQIDTRNTCITGQAYRAYIASLEDDGGD